MTLWTPCRRRGCRHTGLPTCDGYCVVCWQREQARKRREDAQDAQIARQFKPEATPPLFKDAEPAEGAEA